MNTQNERPLQMNFWPLFCTANCGTTSQSTSMSGNVLFCDERTLCFSRSYWSTNGGHRSLSGSGESMREFISHCYPIYNWSPILVKTARADRTRGGELHNGKLAPHSGFRRRRFPCSNAQTLGHFLGKVVWKSKPNWVYKQWCRQ